jgi:PTS system nitrogen regulatory IIA component
MEAVLTKSSLIDNSMEILTIEEVARYLRVSDRTVYEWAQKGEIPAGKIGTVWRFQKSAIQKWVNERLSSKSRTESHKDMPVQVKNILSPERIIFLNHSTKHDALVELAETLASAPQVKNPQELCDEIIRREELMSTAIGRGMAIPHVRLASVTDMVMAVGISSTDIIDFQIIDDIPVRILIMVAAAYNQHAYYLQALSFLSHRLRNPDLRQSLLSAPSSLDVYNLLIQA